MRATLITQLGAPPEPADRPEPVAGDGETLIDVLASAINPIDNAVGSGSFYAGNPSTPYVPGAEAVGRVVRSPTLAVGATVYLAGAGFGTRRDGGLAEQAVAPAAAVVELPADADPIAAAALGIAGLAGWLPLAWRAPVRADDRVLVLGATGSVGLVAVQAAKLLGAGHVIAAGRRPDGLRRAAEAGADATVALDADVDDGVTLAERLREACGGDGPTYVFDPLWGDVAAAAIAAAAPGARIVNLGQGAGAQATLLSGAIRGKQLEIYGYLNFAAPAEARCEAHRRLLVHAARGELRLPYERIGLDGVPDGWTRQACGVERKIVVGPDHSGPPAAGEIGSP